MQHRASITITVEAEDPQHAARIIVTALRHFTEDDAIEDWEFDGQPEPTEA